MRLCSVFVFVCKNEFVCVCVCLRGCGCHWCVCVCVCVGVIGVFVFFGALWCTCLGNGECVPMHLSM